MTNFAAYLRITEKLRKQENTIEAVTGTKGAEYRSSEPYESKTRA